VDAAATADARDAGVTLALAVLGVSATIAAVATPLSAQQSTRPAASMISPAQGASPAAIAASLPAGLDDATRTALVPVFQHAQAQGLPLSLLRIKAAEGVLHSASSARIVAVVTTYEARMLKANAALAPAEPAEIQSGVEALSRGVSSDVLRDIRRRRPNTTVAVPLAVLAQLVSQGVPADRASNIVLRLLEYGVSTRQLAALPQAVADEVASGEPLLVALDSRAANVLSTLGPRPVTPPGGGAAMPTAAAIRPNNTHP